jgi:YHS domain-containing protein
MFRVILYLIFTVILISVLRAVMGIIAKGFGELMGPRPTQSGQSSQSAGRQVPLTGELKKDPACGTYISAATSIHEKVGGETFYFCSKQCRDKYVASLAR